MTAPQLLYASAQTLAERPYCEHLPAGVGTYWHIDIEHLDEMGDLRHKTLVMELMGKHSNLIFCNDDNTIIDSIKHVSSAVSSVREVLPDVPTSLPTPRTSWMP